MKVSSAVSVLDQMGRDAMASWGPS